MTEQIRSAVMIGMIKAARGMERAGGIGIDINAMSACVLEQLQNVWPETPSHGFVIMNNNQPVAISLSGQAATTIVEDLKRDYSETPNIRAIILPIG